ncbi:MAG: helix-turn-helix transcriptional regulator [Kiritimatiellales bacterium]
MKNTTISNEPWKRLVASLAERAREKGMTQQEIARNTGYFQQNISRFFQMTHAPRLDVFLTISKAIGVHFHSTDDPA